MNPEKESELKEAISGLCERLGVKGGFLLLILDEGKIQLTGTLSLSALAPLLLKYLVSKA